MSTTTDVPASITTPDAVQTRIGTLEFNDGAPTPDTAQRLYDNLDFMRGVDAFLSSYPGASIEAIRQGFLDAGVEDNQVLLFPERFYAATGDTPAMCMRLTGIGSQYLLAARDGNGEFLDGGATYRLSLPADIPESRFWSVTLYDRQTRSMLQTIQPMPRMGSQSGTVEQNADGSTELYFGPEAPAGKEENWLQTIPGKGWFPILRLYSPLQAFFDKSWRPSELERYSG